MPRSHAERGLVEPVGRLVDQEAGPLVEVEPHPPRGVLRAGGRVRKRREPRRKRGAARAGAAPTRSVKRLSSAPSGSRSPGIARGQRSRRPLRPRAADNGRAPDDGGSAQRPACDDARRTRDSSATTVRRPARLIATSTRSPVCRNARSISLGAPSRPPSVPSRLNGTSCPRRRETPEAGPRALQAFRIWSRAQPGATTRSASSSPLTSARLPSQPVRQSSAVGRIRPDRAGDDAGVRDGEREPVAGREPERCIQRFVVVVRHDEQAGESAVDLLGGKAVRMRMEPVQPGAVLHLEAQRACSRPERSDRSRRRPAPPRASGRGNGPWWAAGARSRSRRRSARRAARRRSAAPPFAGRGPPRSGSGRRPGPAARRRDAGRLRAARRGHRRARPAVARAALRVGRDAARCRGRGEAGTEKPTAIHAARPDGRPTRPES